MSEQKKTLFLDNIQTKRIRIGQVIFKEGDSGDSAYVLKKGYVEIYKGFAGKKKTKIARLGPGSIFGEMALFGDGARTATVIAISEVEVQVLDQNYFNEALKNSHPLVVIVLKVLIQRLIQTSKNLAYFQSIR